MANNRMYLLHKPTGLAVSLGKRMGWGWCGAPDAKKLNAFYSYLSQNPDYDGSQDDFVLAMEDCSSSSCFDDWRYTDESKGGFPVYEIISKG